MKKKTSLSEEDQALFRQLMVGTRKIKQDTIVHRPLRKKITEVLYPKVNSGTGGRQPLFF